MKKNPDAQPATAPRSSRGCLIYGLIGLVGFPMLLIGGSLLFVTVRDSGANSKVDQMKADLVAKGLPVDDDTLSKYYDKLASEEHTKEWMELIAGSDSDEINAACQGVAVVGVDGGEIPVSPEDDPALKSAGNSGESSDANAESSETDSGYGAEGEPTWDQQKVRDFLALTSELRSRAEVAALRQLKPDAKPVRFQVQFNGIETLLEHAQQMRQLARIIVIQGQVAVYDRDSDATKRSIQTLVGCSRTLEGEPMLVSQLVRIAVRMLSVDLLHRALEQDVLTEQDLAALLPLVLQGAKISPTWYVAHHGERCVYLPIAEGKSSGATADVRWIPFRGKDKELYMEINEALVNVSLSDLDAFRDEMIRQEDKITSASSGGPVAMFDNLLTSMLAPATAAAADAWIREAMNHQIAALAIGIKLHEIRTGEFPKNLEQLKALDIKGADWNPAELQPVGGKPYGYEVDDDGAHLWGFSTRNHSETPKTRPTEDLTMEMESWLWDIPSSKK
ncbi:MAG: hypothetical protein AAF394_00280 [Planctomycetota bacterium]